MRKRPRCSIHRKKRVKSNSKYRSGFEASFAKNLKDKRVTFDYESEVIEWIPPKKKYTPDFIFEKKDGSIMYLELKGRLTVADRTKMKCVKEQHPEKDIRILFQNAKVKLYKGSTTEYGDWATKQGFIWSEGDKIPKEWLKDIKK